MIHIKYELKESALHGIGLFAGEPISAGTVIYTASPLLDVDLTQADFDSLDTRDQQEIRWWGFFDEPSQKWHVDFDVSKFINHAYDATVTQSKDHDDAYLVTTRDLKAGDEITQNYLEFESESDLAKRGIEQATA